MQALKAALEAVSVDEPRFRDVLERVNGLLAEEMRRQLDELEEKREEAERKQLYDQILLKPITEKRGRLPRVDYLTVQNLVTELEDEDDYKTLTTSQLWYCLLYTSDAADE